MKRILCYITLFFCHTLTFGQVDTIAPVNRLNIRVAPLAFLDFYSGIGYKIGAEIKPFKRFSITGDFGGYFKNSNGRRNYSGYNLDFSLRYYLNKPFNGNPRCFLSLHYFYKEQSFDSSDSIDKANPSILAYHTQKYVSVIGVNFGLQRIYKKRLIFEVFAGLGVRFKKVNSTLSSEDYKKLEEFYWDSMSFHFLVKPGNFIYPNFNLGFRIGVILF